MKKTIVNIILSFVLGLLLGALAGLFLSQSNQKGASLGYVGMGHEQLKAKNYIKAIGYFNRAVALNPNSIVGRISLSDAYYTIGNYEMALEEYEITLELSNEEKLNEAEVRYIKRKIEDIKNQLNKDGNKGK